MSYIIKAPVSAVTKPGVMLRGLRLREGYTTRQLSNLTGIPINHLEAIENHIDVMSYDEARVLAEMLNTTVDTFI